MTKINTELVTKATAKLQDEVEKELKQDDIASFDIAAAIKKEKKNARTNPGNDDNNR